MCCIKTLNAASGIPFTNKAWFSISAEQPRSKSERSQSQEHLPAARGVCQKQGTCQSRIDKSHEPGISSSQQGTLQGRTAPGEFVSLWDSASAPQPFVTAGVKSASGCAWALFRHRVTAHLPWDSTRAQLLCWKPSMGTEMEINWCHQQRSEMLQRAWPKSNQFKNTEESYLRCYPSRGIINQLNLPCRGKPMFQGPGCYFHHPLPFSLNSDIQVAFHLQQNF